jgi:hypothetical protein
MLYVDLQQLKLEPVAVSNETSFFYFYFIFLFFPELNAAWKELIL